MGSNAWIWIVAVIIVIIILILLWVWVLPAQPKPPVTDNIFNVTVAEKTPNNKNYGRCSNLCFVINGEESKVLRLKDGETYRFVVRTKGHPFYLTTSSSGGVGAPGAIGEPRVPMESGSFPLVASKDLPQPLYYECALHEYMGARIIVE